MFGYALFNLGYALIQRMLVLSPIYGIAVFHDVPLLFSDTQSVVFSFFYIHAPVFMVLPVACSIHC
jgi:hypothetical protein